MEASRGKTEAVHVKCPCCRQRLFDMDTGTDGVISIKCPKCRAFVSVSMHYKNYRCRKQAVAQE